MDYQFACMLQLLVLCSAFAKTAVRDLVLTPKQSLQINGKSLYYAEETPTDDLHKRRLIPWERTLKHVTYVTVFADAATEAVAGSLSDLPAYKKFLQSLYIPPQLDSNIARFGDIVTLASGRLEVESSSKSDNYRFIEAPCNYRCQERNDVLALWQVQKIRHRDSHRTYRYEMKYIIQPLKTHVQSHSGTRSTTTAEDEYPNTLRIYIQKDDDYPKTFGHLIYGDELSFAERRLDNVAERSFRQVSPAHFHNDHQIQATPIPESTFLRGSFLPPPPPTEIAPVLPNPDSLNIGEYMKSFSGRKPATKEELFRNTASRMGYHPPTTFRPSYNFNVIKPQTYQHPQQTGSDMKFPDLEPQSYSSILSPPLVTHHFHHHFYMPPNADNHLNNVEKQQQEHPHISQVQHQQQLHHDVQQQQQRFQSHLGPIYKPVVQDQEPAIVTYPTSTAFYNNFKSVPRPPSPQKASIPFTTLPEQDEEPPQLLKQHLIQVSPLQPLRKPPQIYQMFPISIGPKIPLFIYPVEESNSESENKKAAATQRNGNKPFIQSQKDNLGPVRYSEPDPLYEHTAENIAPQLEAPLEHELSSNATSLADSSEHNSEQPTPDSEVAQLPPPAKGEDVVVPYIDDEKIDEAESEAKVDQELTSSLKNVKISTEKISSSTVKTEATPTKNSINITTSATTDLMAVTSPESATTANLLTVNEEAATTIETNAMKTEASYITDLPSTMTTTTEEVVKISTKNKPTELSLNTTGSTISQHGENNLVPLTSSIRTPLRTATRRRLIMAATTTEQPVLKWIPRRPGSYSARAKKDLQADGEQLKHEDMTSAVTKQNNTISQIDKDVNSRIRSETFEVLTQKSVSKSVSIKVGKNGEEIPIIDDDSENMVEN